MDDWFTHPDGSIAVLPVIGWQTAMFLNAMSAGLKLDFAIEPTFRKIGTVQLVVTKEQLKELREALQRLEGMLESELATSTTDAARN